MAVSVVAGGGRFKGIDVAFLGGFRVDDPQTGVPADADEGFAACVTSTMRDAGLAVPNDLDPLVERPWKLTEYLESAGAIRKGEIIKRREVIDYFRNYVGGAHHDLLRGATNAKTGRNEILRDLERRVRADTRDGLYFELLSIGQSVGRSTDMAALAAKIRASTKT
jgi:hypothetical protein